MSGAEEAGGGGPAAGPAGAMPAGVGVGAGPGAAAGPAAAAALGEAAGPGLPDEAGLAGARQLQEAAGDPDAPPKKRLRAAEAAEAAAAAAAAGSGKLEERLYSVLCCTVCLDLPKASVYQCTNGHLMCAGCFIHLLADARLKEEQATCPNCRCEISKSLCCRNLAVEKAVSELPSECGFCLRQFPRSLLERHQKEECQDRVTQCKYKRIGCPWHGPFHELTVHEAACAHPTKTGNELMEILDEMDQSHRKEMQLYNSIFSLLSFEKIGYTGPPPEQGGVLTMSCSTDLRWLESSQEVGCVSGRLGSSGCYPRSLDQEEFSIKSGPAFRWSLTWPQHLLRLA
ncbi:cysteine and histidine-rich protein 1-A isoform X2 [Perognathus longimembris pacificus]|uniref:cysteine and histidine-rich protein 1-A isoform X2 n=1 Tax=Perognathus longimembris pacificus TaxID=214514 RepID=UPI002018D43C|nr:cysteine and histidine-rich protein 1-A isoform X2 [Perognathus longimembris pacificus]